MRKIFKCVATIDINPEEQRVVALLFFKTFLAVKAIKRCTMDEREQIRQRKMHDIVKMMEQNKLGATGVSEPVTVTDQNFDEFIKSSKVVLVDCWAEWCMPCRMLGPTIAELATSLSGKAGIGKLNVDDNKATAGKYSIMSIPTMLIFSDGQLVDQLVGVMPKENIQAALERHM